jgi:hypothetical protein
MTTSSSFNPKAEQLNASFEAMKRKNLLVPRLPWWGQRGRAAAARAPFACCAVERGAGRGGGEGARGLVGCPRFAHMGGATKRRTARGLKKKNRPSFSQGGKKTEPGILCVFSVPWSLGSPACTPIGGTRHWI